MSTASKGRTISDIAKPVSFLINVWFIIVSLGCIIPMLYVAAISFTSEKDIALHGYQLIPRHFTLMAYSYILGNPKVIIKAYAVTITVTILGTFLSLMVNSMLGYAISRRDYRYKNFTTLYIFITMLFSGGLVPWYILIANYLHLSNTLWVLILPCVTNPWFVLLMKGFLSTLPPALFDSAKIDGASEFITYVRIVVPLSKPAFATIGLFAALTYWNDWWLAMLFIDNNDLVPLQLLLYRTMASIEYITSNMRMLGTMGIDVANFPNESARMAICVIATGPMLFVFPFFQKYFVKGLTVGSVKE